MCSICQRNCKFRAISNVAHLCEVYEMSSYSVCFRQYCSNNYCQLCLHFQVAAGDVADVNKEVEHELENEQVLRVEKEVLPYIY